MSEPAQKCVNNAIFKQNYAKKLFITFKMTYYCCFGLRGNLDFPDFLQKKFYNINYWIGQWLCGSVGRAIASDTRGPRFDSSHWQNLLNICLLSTELKRRK